jgi:uncharacterized protein YjiS (DUF1127 family)
MILAFLIQAIRSYQKARTTERALMSLDDRALADIGVYRSEIKAVALAASR